MAEREYPRADHVESRVRSGSVMLVCVDPAYAADQLGWLVRPGGSFHGLAHDMVKLYSMLLAGGMLPDGERIVSEETVVSPTTRQHEGLLDETFGIGLSPGPAELLIHHRVDR